MDDKDIVRLFFSRNERAIAEVQKKFGGYCRKIAVNILGNEEDAMECMNDAYLRVWNSIPPKEPEVLSSYIGKIVRNLAINTYNKHHADRRGGGQMPAVLDELGEIVSGRDTPETELHRRELLEALNSFLAALSEEKRTMFICRYWYAESVRSIALKTSNTENNVSVTLNRVRKQLKDYLRERNIEV